MNSGYRAIWRWAWGCFMLAVITGFLYRHGLSGLGSFGFSLENIRHAHSHLMFFSWITPIPMAYMAHILLRKEDVDVRKLKGTIFGILVLGLASWPFFLIYGYRPVSIGLINLPLSVIISGMVMVGWYLFMFHYQRARKEAGTHYAFRFFDAALLLLGICSFGAWGVAAAQFIGIENPLYGKALTHFFLATFTEGWCVLAVLGVLHHTLKPPVTDRAAGWLILPVLFGAPLTFPLGMSAGLITNEMALSGQIGSLMIGSGLLLNGYVLMKGVQLRSDTWIWVVPIVFLMVKAIMQLAAAVTPSSIWLGSHHLRILYLHVLLLGFATVGLLAVRYDGVDRRYPYWIMAGAVIAVLLSLVLLTPAIPLQWSGTWVFHGALGAAFFSVIAAGVILVDLYRWKFVERRGR